MNSIRQLVSLLFFIYMTIAVLLSFGQKIEKPHPVLAEGLLTGTHAGYTIPGSELSIFKPYIPKSGFYSLILDFPYKESDEHAGMREFFWQAQNYMIPVLLNRNPGESKALVFCTNDEIAETRLKETGYEWEEKLADGKGIAIRK